MAVVEKQSTPEQKQAEQAQQEKSQNDIAQNIIKTLDLPTSIASSIDESLDEKESEQSEPVSEESNQDEAQEADDTVSEPLGEEAQESEEEEADLIPKSKVQKRIDELTREKRMLESRLEKLESQSKESEPKDEDLEKLQKMSVEELKDVRKKVLRAQRTADESQLDALFELEEKVNRTIEDAPKRFARTQVQRFNDAVNSTPDLSESELKVVFGHANTIYSKIPSLQKSIDGQAEAWRLAVEHYKEMNKLTVGKSKVNELEQKVNNLKKKTSLDTAVQKGNAKTSDEAKLFNKAKHGSTSDKEAFLKKRLNTDSFIPEEYRG